MPLFPRFTVFFPVTASTCRAARPTPASTTRCTTRSSTCRRRPRSRAGTGRTAPASRGTTGRAPATGRSRTREGRRRVRPGIRVRKRFRWVKSSVSYGIERLFVRYTYVLADLRLNNFFIHVENLDVLYRTLQPTGHISNFVSSHMLDLLHVVISYINSAVFRITAISSLQTSIFPFQGLEMGAGAAIYTPTRRNIKKVSGLDKV